MYLPVDPILSLVVVVGVFIYYACKGSGKKILKDSGRSIEEIFRDINEQNRYQKWLLEHRQD